MLDNAAGKLIENHGVIGNMRSAALVSIEGAIDFFCFPRFDSPTVFAALLDADKGGCFRIEPQMDNVRYKQHYLPDTNILLTRYLTEDGVAELIDFMPVDKNAEQEAYAHQIIRRLRVIKGEVRFKMRCSPRLDYGRGTHQAHFGGQSVCFTPDNPDLPALSLHSTTPLTLEAQDAVADFVLKKGESACFAFGFLRAEEKEEGGALNQDEIEVRFQSTYNYWRDWIGKSSYKGRWREIVNRSALVLKLLFSQEHKGTIAAITFGMPEKPGGVRNWDYRYTWLRDSSFCLYALVRLGLSDEVHSYTEWLRARLTDGLHHNLEDDGPLRIMYRVDGTSDLDEVDLDHLSGYQGSKPIWIGNGASSQLQLDVYGEIMDAVYLSNKYSHGISKDGWARVIHVLDWLGHNWEREDEGIWETRGGRRHLLHSRLMCWVAFDRAIRLSEKRSLDAPLNEWYETRKKINADILTNFWDDELQSFVQAKGEKAVDAALLLMPMLRYISPTDPRWLSTLSRIESTLCEDCLVFRYEQGTDGIKGGEGSFTPCSFWLIECLARSGQVEKAALLFNKMLGYANHLGLYSEQLGSSGEQLGNFPQSLSHLALISAATFLDRKLDGVRETWA